MKSKNNKSFQQQKSKELLALSSQLFTTAKQLSEYHVAELNSNMAHALDYAKTAENQDVTKLKALQASVTADATKRLETYQSQVKTVLNQMESKPADQYLKKARSTLSAWYKQAQKKVPQGAEQLGQVAHDIADTGMKAFKEGRKLVAEAADAAEKDLKKAAKQKPVTAKQPAIKKSVAKKLPVKKVAAKKVSTK